MNKPFIKYHIYADESSTSSRYTVIGSIFCSDEKAALIKDCFEQVIGRYPKTTELKWAKVTPRNLPLYKSTVDLFFQLYNRRLVQFHSIVIDTSTQNHKLYNDGDKEIGFNKMLFQLLFGYIRKFRHKPKFYAYLDHRTTKHSPEKLRQMLNAKARKKWGFDHRPYRVCQFRDSKAERLIQIADILSGAIAYRWNGHSTKVDAAPQRVELLKYITEHTGLVSLSIETPYESKFNIWPIDLTGRSRAPRLWKPWR